MTTYIQFLLESSKKQKFDKTVALVAGSYRPPTPGHLYMVEYYAGQADEVVILISAPKSAKSIRKTALGTSITPKMSKEIWDLYIKRYGLKNVKVIVSDEPSPITAMFKYMDDNLHDVNVILGVSKKMDDDRSKSDVNRFRYVQKYVDDYYNNKHILILDPGETAVDPLKDTSGKAISATDIRNSLDKPDEVKKMLPSKLSDAEKDKVIEILAAGPKAESLDENEQLRLPEEECLHAVLDDETLKQAKFAAYNNNQTAIDQNGKEVPVNPKKFPNKAISVIVPLAGISVRLFLDADEGAWDSDFIMNGIPGKLSPEQMGQFFSTDFYKRLVSHMQKVWPTSDDLYSTLYDGLVSKKMLCQGAKELQTEDGEFQDDQVRQSREKREKLRQKEKDKEAKAKYTNSGRKIVSFSDFGVKNSSFKGYCWPPQGKEFRWSTWKDWKKIKPICRMSFKHNDYNYGVSISTYDENFENRGFRGYNLDIEPPLAWITPDECEQVMQLSLFQKFARHCVKRIQKYLDIPTEELLAKINNPEKITAEEIDKTKSVIRKVLKYAIKPCKADTFSWK